MKLLLLPAFIFAGATTAMAQTNDISTMIDAGGLDATEQFLAGLDAPNATERFALGGVRFLGAVETAMQTRYNTGISEGLAVQSGLPMLRMPLPPNPNAVPFTPDVITSLFADISEQMNAALPPLQSIGDEDDVELVINTSDIWFDINSNGQRDIGEGMLEVVGFALTPQWGDGPQMQNITIRFDTSDAAWLSAYAHLLAGISEIILAVDPTEAIDRVLTSREAMVELAPLPPSSGEWFSKQSIADSIDLFSMFAMAIDQQPDQAHARAALEHFRAVIEDNKTFWYRVATENDNEAEWIPNKQQTSALPFEFPTNIGPMWQAVLADAEKLLNGETLLPYWRVGPEAGINLAAFLNDPPYLDPVGLIQGETLLPYIELGPRINESSLNRFGQMLRGDTGLFMIILN